jgi:hypothetical protein
MNTEPEVYLSVFIFDLVTPSEKLKVFHIIGFYFVINKFICNCRTPNYKVYK